MTIAAAEHQIVARREPRTVLNIQIANRLDLDGHGFVESTAVYERLHLSGPPPGRGRM
jgi:hypothetical protein